MTENEAQINWKKAHHEATARHVVVAEAVCSQEDKHKLFKLADNLRLLGNEIVAFLNKNYEQLTRTKAYRNLKDEYGKLSDKLSKLEKDTPPYNKIQQQRNKVAKQMSEMQQQYHVTYDEARQLSQLLAIKYNMNSILALARVEAIWQGMEDVLYKDGKKLHYKKHLDLPVIQAKQINRGIILSTDGETLSLSVGGRKGSKPIKLKVQKPKTNDLFLQEELASIIAFLSNPSIEDNYIEAFKLTGVPGDTFRPCYVQLKCERIRNKNRIFVEIVVEGNAKPKKKKDGTPRHKKGTGIVAIDLGPQSVAYTSQNQVGAINLGERSSTEITENSKQEAELLRQMERSRRAMNPKNYNADGTIKKGRKKWKKSKRYKRLLHKLIELRRKARLTRKYANQEIVNHLRSLGNICITEPSNIKAMQRRSKKTELQDKETTITKKDGTTKTIRKYKKKKRGGKSVGNRAPGQVLEQSKLKFDQVITVDKMFRASQYDHTVNNYIKKKLSDRMYALSDGTNVQRDCYSSFLMFCANADYTAPDLELCLANFDKFLTLMNAFIDYVQINHIKIKNFFNK